MSRKRRRRESERERLARVDPWHRDREEAVSRIRPEDERRRHRRAVEAAESCADGLFGREAFATGEPDRPASCPP